MPVVITAQATIEIGAAEPVQGNAPECDLAAVFEDDGDTGYFYALDFSQPEQPIQNALHIYNVADIIISKRIIDLKVLADDYGFILR